MNENDRAAPRLSNGKHRRSEACFRYKHGSCKDPRCTCKCHAKDGERR